MSADATTLQTPHGLLRAAHTAPSVARLRVGDRAQAAVRPEFVQIEAAGAGTAATAAGAAAGTAASAANSGGSNRVGGTLIGVSHLGETMQYLVQLDAAPGGAADADGAGTQSMLVRRPTPEAPRLSLGDAVVCSWHPLSLRIFTADPLPAVAHVDLPTLTTTEE